MKMKLLSTAVAAGLGMGLMATAAQASYINAQGTGQALLYPYYSAESGNDTYIQITNTSNVGKVVKVRFLESKNSQEVLDFNLYLSAHDVWAGAVTATADGAKLVTQDKSCTVGVIPTAGQPFVNYQYTGDSDNSIARTREGHVEIIGMSDIVAGSSISTAITHVAGVPKDCSFVQTDANNTAANGLTTPTGGLYGYAHLVNVANGTDAVYDATAIANFSATDLYTTPGSITPNLASTDTDPTSFNGTAAVTTLLSDFASSSDAISSLFMTRDLMNDYVVDPAIKAGTDWVVTFPTKTLYVNNGMATATTANAATPPFTAGWNTSTSTACEPIALTYYDREEQYPAGSSIQFSPPPPTSPGNALCYEANVITFNNSNVLGSPTALNLPVDYASGWMDLQFNGTGNTITTTGTTPVVFHGLPAMGFADIKFTNGNVGGLLSNYAGITNHKDTSPF